LDRDEILNFAYGIASTASIYRLVTFGAAGIVVCDKKFNLI